MHAHPHKPIHARPSAQAHPHKPIRTSPSVQAHPRRSIRMPTQVGPSVICTHAHARKPIHARRSILTLHAGKSGMYPTSPSLFLRMPARVHTTACMQVHPHQVSPSTQLPHPRVSIGSTVHAFDLVT